MGIKNAVGDKKKNGKRAENHFTDVIYARQLLNYHITFNPSFLNQKDKFTLLPVVGVGNMSETIRAIKTFQMYVLKIQSPTGCLEKGDTAIVELEKGYFPGVLTPDNLAPIEDVIHNKLLRASKSAHLILDFKGEIRSMLDMLLNNPDVDDRYLRNRYFEGDRVAVDHRMNDYIEDAPPDIPPPPINFEVRVKNYLTKQGLKYLTVESFFKFIVRIADEIRSGYTSYFTMTGKYTLSIDKSNNGQYAASENVDNWFKARFADKNSIYSCFPKLLEETKSHSKPIDDWKGYWKGTGDMINPFK